MVKSRRKSGPPPKDMAGERFDRLIAIEYIGKGKWRCQCDCGKTTEAHGSDMRRGKVRSCGCLHIETSRTGDNRRKHGMSESPEYRSWHCMIRRCTDPTTVGYNRYGGRGISVCDRWLHSFENFFADMGARPKGTTLDRKEVNGNYEPGNCRWADKFTQAANTSKVILISANGKTMPVEAWARELRVSPHAIRYRLKLGLSHEETVNRPFRKYKSW
jgi:hypothetical protein